MAEVGAEEHGSMAVWYLIGRCGVGGAWVDSLCSDCVEDERYRRLICGRETFEHVEVARA